MTRHTNGCAETLWNESLTAPKASASLWLLLLKTGRRLCVEGRGGRGCSSGSSHPAAAPSSAAFPPRPRGTDSWAADGPAAPPRPAGSKWPTFREASEAKGGINVIKQGGTSPRNTDVSLLGSWRL